MADSETVAFYYLAFNFVAFFTAVTKEIFQHNSAFPVTFNLIFRVIVTLVQRTAIDDSWNKFALPYAVITYVYYTCKPRA